MIVSFSFNSKGTHFSGCGALTDGLGDSICLVFAFLADLRGVKVSNLLVDLIGTEISKRLTFVACSVLSESSLYCNCNISFSLRRTFCSKKASRIDEQVFCGQLCGSIPLVHNQIH